MNNKKIYINLDFKFNKNSKKIMGTIIILFFVFMIIIGNNFNTYAEDKYSSKISFYVKIINLTLPTVEEINKDDNKYVQSYRHRFAEKMGFDIFSPMSILKNQLVFFDYEEEKIDNQKEYSVIKPFSLDEKQINNVDKTKNKDDNYDPSLRKKLDVNKPEILIYHTHTGECYVPAKRFNTHDEPNNSVIAVGDVLAKELVEKYGISVIHDKTIHDVMYNTSYSRSGVTLDNYMKKYGDFKLIIDLHRDAIKDKRPITANINGKSMARYMLVGDSKNPRFNENMKHVNALIAISDKLYPGLIRDRKTLIYNGGIKHFNQDRSNNCILIEAGANTNHIDEAKNTAVCLARIIAEYLNK